MDTLELELDRVREHSTPAALKAIDRATDTNIFYYSRLPKPLIEDRIMELNEEWDTERVLQLVSGTSILAGLTLGFLGKKRYFFLSAVAAAFTIQHARQGYCAPLSIIRKFGVRTKNEIDREKNALMQILNS